MGMLKMAPDDFSGSYFLGARAAPDLVFVGEFRKNVTRQTWQALFHFGEYLFQSTRQNGECLKKMVSHTVRGTGPCETHKPSKLLAK
jgi:hypothetical protein